MDNGVADRGLTAWLSRHTQYIIANDPYENRTRVTAVKGRCLDRLTNGPYEHLCTRTPRAGLEPATTRLTAECSTIELSRIKGIYLQNFIQIFVTNKKSVIRNFASLRYSCHLLRKCSIIIHHMFQKVNFLLHVLSAA